MKPEGKGGRRLKLVLYVSLLAALGAALLTRFRWERQRRAQAHDRLGMAYFNHGNLAAAAREIRREIAVTPENALAYYKLGIIELQRGQYQEARNALSQAIARRVEQPQAPCALGLAAFRMSDYSAAVQPLKQCLARNPGDDDARYLLASSYMGQARLDEAEQSFRELLNRRPNNSQVLYSLGTIYLYRPSTPANNTAALAVLQQAVAVGHAPPGAYYSLGLVYRRAGRWPEAAAALEKAVRADPQLLEARRALGLVYRRLGREQEANEQFRITRAGWAAASRDKRLTYLRNEVLRNPTNPMTHFQLGCLYEELDDNRSALAELEAAARLDPKLPDAHEHIARIDERIGKPLEAQQERALAERLSRESGPPIAAQGR